MRTSADTSGRGWGAGRGPARGAVTRGPGGLLGVLALVVVAVGGCAGDDRAGAWDPSVDPATVGPFAPREMRIYPLSHLERREGGARVICHVEFVDRWFDTCKAYGSVVVELYRSAGGSAETQAATWTADLTDLEFNAEMFDPVTRTYRLQLDLPAGVVVGEGGAVRLRATYSPAGGVGGGMQLKDELVVRG